MSPKRGDAVAPPAVEGEWQIRFGNTSAIDGWKQLCTQAAGNTRRAWDELRTNPAPVPPNSRHGQLKGALAAAAYRGKRLPQWQYEVTGGGRIWYLIDDDKHTLWLVAAGTGHPKSTE